VGKARKLERGTVILVPLDDYHGNIEPHHAVVLSSTAACERGDKIIVAGVSTGYRTPLPPGQFYMDYIAGRPHPETGLSESCVVKGDWPNLVEQADIIQVFKRCSPAIVKGLIQFVNANPPPGFPSLS